MRFVFLPDCLNGRLRSEPSNCRQRAAASVSGLIALSYVSNSQDLSQFLASVGSAVVIATAVMDDLSLYLVVLEGHMLRSPTWIDLPRIELSHCILVITEPFVNCPHHS